MTEYSVYTYNSGINHLIRFLLFLLVILLGIFLLRAPELFFSQGARTNSTFPIGDQVESRNTQ